MTKKVFSLMFVIAAIIPCSFSATYVVPDDYPTIQAAIDASVTGDSIFVQQGLYMENLFIEGKGLYISSFFATPSLENMRETIIDGSAGGPVIFAKDCSDTLTIRGFTLCNGYNIAGAGIRCFHSSVNLQDMVIRNNATTAETWATGGGIHASHSSLDMKNVLVTQNTAYDQGGGIAVRSESALRGEGVVVTGNTCGGGGHGKGGGVFADLSSEVHLYRSVISDNIASNWGGGVCLSFSTTISLVNVTLTGNFAGQGGGAVYCCYEDSRIFLGNCILRGNMGNIGYPVDQEVWFDETGDRNELAFCFSDIEGGRAGMYIPSHSQAKELEGNIDQMPYFNPELSLASPSPCIDAGTDHYTYWGLELIDIPPDQYSGIQPDMGAFENWDIVVNAPEQPAAEGNRVKVYPNPASGTVNIELQAPPSGEMELELSDMRGAVVLTKAIPALNDGQRMLRLDLGHLPSGLYILSLFTGTERHAEQIIKW